MMSLAGGTQTNLTLSRLITAYYENLFATSFPSEFDEAVEGIGTMVTKAMNDNLDTEPTAEEIRTAVFQMHHTKALGADGFHALFYQKFWDVVGDDVVCFVKQW